MAETSSNVNNIGTTPVDGVAVATTGTALTSTQSIRQAVAIGDGAGAAATFAAVGADGTLAVSDTNNDVLNQILAQLKLLNYLLCEGFKIPEPGLQAEAIDAADALSVSFQ